MNRKDLPTCNTCRHLDITHHGEWECGNAEMLNNLPDCVFVMDSPVFHGCIYHSDYDEPKTQTEANDE